MRPNSHHFIKAIAFILFVTSAFFSQAQQEKNVTVFGAKINYVEAGDPAKPTVVLVHGLGGTIQNWAFTIPAMSQNYHVFALDQVGFGKSSKPEHFQYSFQQLAHNTKTLLDSLKG